MSALFTNVLLRGIAIGPASGCSITGPSLSTYSTAMISSLFTGTMDYGLGKFAGVGFNNSGAFPAYSFYSSDNGQTWSYTSSGINAEYRLTVFGGDRFVAVAGNSATSNRNAVSTDGINWSHYTNLPSSSYWYGLGYGAGKFVTGAYASSVLASSTNGITWSSYSTTLPGVDTIAYGNGVWVSAYRNASTMYRSSDAITWTAISPAVPAGGVIFNNGIFISVVYSTISQFKTSVDGVTWTTKNFPASGSWAYPRWNGDVWVVWGVVGGVGSFYWSTDLNTWGQVLPTTTTTGGPYATGAGKTVLYNTRSNNSYVVSC